MSGSKKKNEENKEKNEENKEKRIDNRKTTYRMIIYPESAREDWLEYIKTFGVIYYISPIHDRDLDKNGEIKKAHYHVIIQYKSKKSLEQFYNDFHEIGAVIDMNPPTKPNHGSISKCLEHDVRYLVHADDKSKVQYSIDDIVCPCNIDIRKRFFTEDAKEKATNDIACMLRFIKDNKIHKYADFVDSCLEDHFDWFEILTSTRAGIFINEYLKSKYPPVSFSRGMR